MRRDLVAEVLEAVSDELFETVVYTPPGGAAVTVDGAIFGVEPAAARYDELGAAVRDVTHVTRGLKVKLPGLGKGALINDGEATYRVLDVEPIGDGRFEVLIALRPV